MTRNLAQMLNNLLHSCEMMEEELKQKSNLKNLTSRQLYCIELIDKMQNPSLSQLADKMKIARASISVMIDRLEKNNYIRKVTSDQDKRSAHVHLTEAGKKAATLHTELHKRIAVLLTEEMTESEKEILIVLLKKAVMSLAKHSDKLI